MIAQIQNSLLIPNGLDEKFLDRELFKLMERHVDFCDFYIQSITSESWALDEGIIKSGNFAMIEGIGLRAVCHDKTFLSYSNTLTPKVISNLVDGLFIQSTPKLNAINRYNHTSSNLNLYTTENPISNIDSKTKIDLLKEINQSARQLDYVTNVIASLSLEYEEVYIARDNNRHFGDIRPLIHLSISIIVNKNEHTEKGHSGLGGRYLLEGLTTELIQLHINKAYQTAILKTEAVAGPSGQMPVVLGNGWAGVILHEAVGHGLEGDFNRKGSSAFSNKIGQQVANKNVTVIDEGCITNRRGSLNIDDEGNPTQKTILIENGILKGYLFDELNANLMGASSTGNGRRESFSCNPMPRMTNTYMLGGEYTHEEIIQSIDDGIYAENFEGGQVDITSGQFVFNCSIAWVIKNGKLAYPIKGCALVGNGPECLKYVSMVGNNLELDSGIGVCGKDGQSVPVGVGQPTIRIDNGLIVGGG